MSVAAVTLFLALLAVVAQASVATAGVLTLAGRGSAAVGRRATSLRATLRPDALWLAAAVATVATLGSLYFSEIANFTPCRLCWYQRFAMYPLAPLLAFAAWRRAAAVRVYAAVLATVGMTISIYHVMLERFPQLEGTTCDPTNPCTLIWVRRFGYLTIPTMAVSAFALILLLLVLAPPAKARPARPLSTKALSTKVLSTRDGK